MVRTGPGRTLWRGTAVIALLIPLCNPAWCATYHVDRNHPQASDENPGTQEKPFKTINAGFKKLQPGDTVWVRKGVYREHVMLSTEPGRVRQWEYTVIPSGKSYAQMINFYAWPGEEVVIKGSDVVKDWKPYKDKIWVRDNWEANSQQVFVDGKILQQIGGEMVKLLVERGRWRGRKGDGLNDMEPGSFYYDIQGKKLYIWLKDGADPNQHEIEASVRPFLWKMKKLDYIRVVGFTLRHANTSTVVNWPAVTVNGHYNILENIDEAWSDFCGVGLSGSNHSLVNCTFNHNGCAGIGARGWGHRFINCETSYNNYRHWSAGWHAGGVKIIPEAHDVVMSGHVAAYNYKSPGIWFDGMNSNVTIRNCICHHNGLGIMYEISERGTIKNNICYENEGRGIYVSNSAYCAILHNICYKNGMSGIVVIGVERYGQAYGRGEKGCWPGAHNAVWGNICMDNCHPDLCPKNWHNRPELILPSDTDYNQGNLSDYNLFYRSDGRPIQFWKNWGTAVAKDLKEWQEKHGQDKHSIVAKPLFKDLAKRDFRPVEGSPALWMVKPTPSTRFDFTGAERPRRETYLTAGALEPDPELLEAYLAGKKPAVAGKYKLVLLPEKLLQSTLLDDKSLDPVAFGIRSLERKPVAGGIMGIELAGVPFAQKERPEAVLLTKDNPTAIVPVRKAVKEMHLLLAAIDPGEGPLAKCIIHREDGVNVILAWEGGRNIGPSIGPWQGTLTQLEGQPGKTDMVWQGEHRKHRDMPARLFRTVWSNDNEWYPIKQLEWKLENPNAQVLILAITIE